MEKQKAVYPLSADPVHNGHINILKTAVDSGLFDKVYFSIGNNDSKKYVFDLEERVDLAKKVVYSSGVDTSRVIVESFSGLLRNYALTKGIGHIVRGIRGQGDVSYEVTLSNFNAEYGLKTIMLPSSSEYQDVSSSLVRSVVSEGGFVHKYVHPGVKQALEEKMNGVSLVGVTGNRGCGKTTFCRGLVDYLNNTGTEAHHIDFDNLVHGLYGDSGHISRMVRDSFGDSVFDGDVLDRRKLGKIVFEDEEKRMELVNILRNPSVAELENRLRDMRGVVLIDAAYFTEYDMLPLVNYNTILVGCNEDVRLERVMNRDSLSVDEVRKRGKAQHSYGLKRKIILDSRARYDHGFFCEVDNTQNIDVGVIGESLRNYFSLEGRIYAKA